MSNMITKLPISEDIEILIVFENNLVGVTVYDITTDYGISYTFSTLTEALLGLLSLYQEKH